MFCPKHRRLMARLADPTGVYSVLDTCVAEDFGSHAAPEPFIGYP